MRYGNSCFRLPSAPVHGPARTRAACLQVIKSHNRGGVTFFKERHDRYNDTLIIYEVEGAFSCEDLKTRNVKFAGKAREGPRARRASP